MMNNINSKTGTYIRSTLNGDETFNFRFYINLSSSDKLKFVNSVVDLLVDEERYNSVIRDIIFDFYVIDIMTDIDTSDFKKSSNFIDDVEEFLLSTNIVEIVEANAFPTLFDNLNKAVDKSIEYRTGIHPSPLNEALASLLLTLEKKINEVDLNSMMGMASKLAGMTDELTIDNLVNAYMNSDIHKNNLIEIEEFKKKKSEIAENLDKAIKEINSENTADDEGIEE